MTNGARAGVVVVFARTGDDALGAFLVSPEAAGYQVGTSEKTLGLRASETVTVDLDVVVSADSLLGDAQSGYRYALEALEVGRLCIAAQAVGIAQGCAGARGALCGRATAVRQVARSVRRHPGQDRGDGRRGWPLPERWA